MALLDTMGLKRCPGTILPMGDGLYVDVCPVFSLSAARLMPDNCYILAHVPARYQLDGFRIITVIRDPRNVLVSYVRHRNRVDGVKVTIQQALANFWDWGPFVELYRSFLGWIGRSIIIRYEDMPAKMIGNGSGIYRDHHKDWNTRTGKPSKWYGYWNDEVEAAWQKHDGPRLLSQAGYT